MFNLLRLFKITNTSARISVPNSGPPVSDSDGGIRDGRRRQLLTLAGKVVERSTAGTKAGLVVMRAKAIPTDVGGYEYVVLVDLKSLPEPEVLHEIDGKIAKRAREKLGLSVKALYWRGVGVPLKRETPVETQIVAEQTFHAEPVRQLRRTLPEPAHVDFALSTPADRHLQELGLSRPATLTA